jgi:hypothetical protein
LVNYTLHQPCATILLDSFVAWLDFLYWYKPPTGGYTGTFHNARDQLVAFGGDEAFAEVGGGGYLLNIWSCAIVDHHTIRQELIYSVNHQVVN